MPTRNPSTAALAFPATASGWTCPQPDAHLEILRQRQIYQVLSDTAAETDSQVIAASHSEVILNEAADRDPVIAFVGRPHRIDDRGSQVLKALKEIGFEHYSLGVGGAG